MVKFGSPLYWVLTLVFAVVLIGGNYVYVKLFTQTIEPAARTAVQESLGVEITAGWRGFWKVKPESLDEYPDSKFWLEARVFTLFAFLTLFFALGFIIEMILLYVVAGRLFRDSA